MPECAQITSFIRENAIDYVSKSLYGLFLLNEKRIEKKINIQAIFLAFFSDTLSKYTHNPILGPFLKYREKWITQGRKWITLKDLKETV